MSERPSERPAEHVGPRYVFLGTLDHDCRAGLPADAPERAWPVETAFPKYVFLGTVEYDCLTGLPADAPERSWPVAEFGPATDSPTEVPKAAGRP